MRQMFLCLFFFICTLGNANPIVIGTLAYDPPFEMKESQRFVSGFDIDIMSQMFYKGCSLARWMLL